MIIRKTKQEIRFPLNLLVSFSCFQSKHSRPQRFICVAHPAFFSNIQATIWRKSNLVSDINCVQLQMQFKMLHTTCKNLNDKNSITIIFSIWKMSRISRKTIIIPRSVQDNWTHSLCCFFYYYVSADPFFKCTVWKER